jgi:hypothetical protein
MGSGSLFMTPRDTVDEELQKISIPVRSLGAPEQLGRQCDVLKCFRVSIYVDGVGP